MSAEDFRNDGRGSFDDLVDRNLFNLGKRLAHEVIRGVLNGKKSLRVIEVETEEKEGYSHCNVKSHINECA